MLRTFTLTNIIFQLLLRERHFNDLYLFFMLFKLLWLFFSSETTEVTDGPQGLVQATFGKLK